MEPTQQQEQEEQEEEESRPIYFYMRSGDGKYICMPSRCFCGTYADYFDDYRAIFVDSQKDATLFTLQSNKKTIVFEDDIQFDEICDGGEYVIEDQQEIINRFDDGWSSYLTWCKKRIHSDFITFEMKWYRVDGTEFYHVQPHELVQYGLFAEVPPFVLK